MGASQRLRLPDVRQVYRLIGECQEVGTDPTAWRRHLANGVRRLTGAQVVVVAEATQPTPNRRLPRVRDECAGWLTPTSAACWRRYIESYDTQVNPIHQTVMRHLGRSVTWRREQLLPDDRAWYRSGLYGEYVGRCGLDDTIFSQRFRPGVPHMYAVMLHRAGGDRRFQPREQRLAQLVHHELGPHLGRSLADLGRSTLAGLAPRLRRTLVCLLDGDSEKLVAKRLGLSAHTVHEYVGRLYRHFGVQSRSELLAACFRIRVTADGCERLGGAGR
jgi:DNA-binding CsgD family transcriptional regulator